MKRVVAIVCLLTSSLLVERLHAAELSEFELSIWNDPAFKKQFIQSYIAETEIEPPITTDERDKMLKVLELISADEMDKAVSLLQKHRGEAASAVFDFTLANIHFQRDALDQAAADYEVAVKRHDKFRRAWQNLGLIRVRQNRFEDAIEPLTRVIKLGGGDAITYGLLGYCYSNVENHISAETAYRTAILFDAQTMEWKMGLARSFFKQERFADAVALTRQLIADQPERADFWLLQANAYIGMNQPLRAAENYELVDRMGQSTADSLNMLADIYVNEDLFELAVTTYIRAMKKDARVKPDRAIRAAKVMTARGALPETRELVESIEKLHGERLEDSERKDMLKLRARIAVAEGSGEDEARVLEEIVALDPLDGEALILLGQRSGRAGDIDKAIFYFERAASIEKYEADAKVRHAQLLVQNGKYAEALPLLRSAQQIKPRDNVQEYLDQLERLNKTR